MGDSNEKGRQTGEGDEVSRAPKAKKDPRDVILARRARFVSVALAGVGMMASLEGCDSCGPQVCLEPAPHPVPPDLDNPSVCLKIAPSRDAGAGGNTPADAGAHDAEADAGMTDAGADASADDVQSLTGDAGTPDAGAPDAGRPKPPKPPPRVCLRRVRPPPMPCLSPARVCLMILPDRPPPPPPPPPNVPLKGERKEDSDKRKV